jgi:hypothetical protein
MDYMSGFPSTKHGHDCIFVAVDWFSKMDSLEPSKKSITSATIDRILFEHVSVHFGLPQTIISYRDNMLLSTFYFILWSLRDTKLTKLTSFHPHKDG